MVVLLVLVLAVVVAVVVVVVVVIVVAIAVLKVREEIVVWVEVLVRFPFSRMICFCLFVCLLVWG